MIAINQVLARIVDVLMRPAVALPPLVSVAVISVVTAVVMLLVARATSDPREIADAKRAIQADLFEVRLFNDDLRAIFRALGLMLAHSLRYLRLSLVPALWLIVPITLLTIHLDPFYGYTGLAPGETTMVTASVSSEAGRVPAAELRASPAVRIDSSAVWFPSTHELIWRVTGVAPGLADLVLTVDGQTVHKSLQVSTGVARRSPARPGPGEWLQALLNPSEPPLPAGNLNRVTVAYPEADFGLWKFDFSWLVWYLVFALAAALLLRRTFGVEL